MKMAHELRWLAVVVSVLLAGCKGEEPKTPDTKQYAIQGKVLALDASKPSVKLDHEDIPGLMSAMKMSFDVADAKLLDGLKVGDEVRGQMKVESGKYVITELKKR